MTPILGILASGISGNLWTPGKDFDSIATVVVGSGGASTITFSSIPSTYRHLQLRLYGQTNQGNNGDGVLCRFNGDTANNYTLHWLYGNGVTPTALGLAPYGGIRIPQIAGDYNQPNPSSFFGPAILDVLDYANTNKFKTGRVLSGYDMNGIGAVSLGSGVWMNSASAISSITLSPTGGSGFKNYTHAALYGVK